MYFIDLNKIKITKDYVYKTYEYNLVIPDEEHSIKNIFTIIAELLNNKAAEFAALRDFPTAVIINLDANITDEEDFITFVNIINTAFFTAIIEGTPRKREYRLDVTDSLKGANCSLKMLKDAINKECRLNVFNYEVRHKDLVYQLVDEHKGGLIEEFKHTVEELNTNAKQ